MDLFKLIKWILQYLPWPITVVITILIFKKYINVFLEKLTKLKIGDFEFTAKEYSVIKTPAIENNELEIKSGATPAENQIQKVEGKGEAIETTGRVPDILAKHLIFEEIRFNHIEIMSYIDKLLRMWPFFKTQPGLNAMSMEQKINLLVSNNKLDLNAGRDILNSYNYWSQNKDRINLIENLDELLKNYSTTRNLIIYLKSLT